MIDCAWEEIPPNTAAKQIRNTVSQLRNLLDGSAIVPVSAGYRLDPGDGSIDAVEFAQRVVQARREAANQQVTTAVNEYRAGLALWRGSALLGLHCAALQPTREGLNEQRLTALEECAGLELALGNHHLLTSELAEWVTRHPLREGLAAYLMLAVYRTGRQADALAVYDRTKHALATELGLDPGPELQELRQRILTNDPALSAGRGPRCDLPGDVSHFTGRADELRHLVLDRATPGTAMVISAIDGMAGIGKTTLAVHAAHRLTERYPDAQLFIDLHAHTPGHQPLSSASALERLLRAIGVPGEKMPQNLEERAALWRARLTDRRMLILLDNVADTAQIRPLLPGAASCLTLITSRHRLTSLEGAGLLSLDVLPLADARALFSRVVGDDRPAADPDGLDTILRLCGFLPLAIRIAAARLRHRPTWTVGHLAERLLDHQRRLAELQAEDRSVIAAFDLSYQHLEPRLQRFFRLLGVSPGPDVDTYAAAALTGLSYVDIEGLLESLVDAHLLEQPTPGRYRFHDLLRAYANQLPGSDRSAALTRLLDYYLHAAGSAMNTLVPYEKHRRPELAALGSPVPDLTAREAALAWLDTEFPNLLAAAHRGTTHAGRLSTTLWRYAHIRGNHDDALALHGLALRAARVAGDPSGEAHALTNIGDNHWWLGHYRDAVASHEQALALAAGDPVIESRARHGLGLATWRLGEYERALEQFSVTLGLATAAGDRNLEGYALRGLGIVHCRLRNYGQARGFFQQVLDLARTARHQNIESRALRGLGEVCLGLGQHEQAGAYFGQALKVPSNTYSDRASILHGLGVVQAHRGNHSRARQQFREALELAREVHNSVLETEVLNTLGECARLAADFEAALGFHREALALATELEDGYELARARDGIADVRAQMAGR